jgi:hypothetical protein
MSLEEGPKAENQVVNEIRHLLERWEHRLTLDNPRFIERYAKAELHLLAHFKLPAGIERDFVAYFQAIEVRASSPQDHIVGHREVSDDFRSDVFDQALQRYVWIRNRRYRNEQAMLISTVQAIEDGQLRTLSSVVWFDTVDRVYSVLPQALYFSRSAGFVQRGAAVGGKIEVSGRSIGSTVNQEQLVDQVVEGAPQVLDHISDDGAEVERDWSGFRQIKAWLANMRIALGRDFVGMRCGKDPDLGIDLSDVLAGPFDFNPNQSQSFVSCHDERIYVKG